MVFDWDENNLSHIAKHGIEAYEAEDIFFDDDNLGTHAYNTDDEKRYGILGKTEEGRILKIIYTLRGGNIRVISAMTANKSQTKRYRNNQKKG